MTYQALLQDAAEKFNKMRLLEAQQDAWLLFESVTGMNLATYLVKQEEEASREEVEKLQSYVEERITGRPIQLIIGETEFMGFKFVLDGKELIPRQDTEVLVEKVLEFKKKYDKLVFGDGEKAPTLRLLDLCTGSGCIATSLALLGNFSKVMAGDISKDALNNAVENAKRLGADISFKLGDMFEPFKGEIFDIITANPPYIRSAEIKDLMPEVRDYDPRIALDGGADGLIFYRRFAVAARSHLAEGGAVFVEIGHDQALQVTELFAQLRYKDITTIKDYAGNDRVVIARK